MTAEAIPEKVVRSRGRLFVLIPLFTILHLIALAFAVPLLNQFPEWIYRYIDTPMRAPFWTAVALLAGLVIVWPAAACRGHHRVRVFALLLAGFSLHHALFLAEGRGIDALRANVVVQVMPSS
ncbi:MAG: hypothetical protein HUJ24_03000 [Rhodobacteraceae bacterium]|nr:hypothetical protein [Paracoccaceae bacterium]